MQRDPFATFAIKRKAQLITKSDQLFADTRFLFKSKRHAAALYLGGFVVECLLKAAVWKRRHEKKIGQLLYSHNLTALLEHNSGLAENIRRADAGAIYIQFVRLSNWNVRFRYNPAPVAYKDAEDFMRRLSEVRAWLRNRV
jgi:HEPN domain-containing protein